jgi:hypothetical protein
VFHLVNNDLPTQREIAHFYMLGKTKDEILKIYMVDNNQTLLGKMKQDTKQKINHFFKVLEGSRTAYVENPKSRICFEFLVSQTSRGTLINTKSCRKILEALTHAGWNIEKETEGLELKDKFENKRVVSYIKS